MENNFSEKSLREDRLQLNRERSAECRENVLETLTSCRLCRTTSRRRVSAVFSSRPRQEGRPWNNLSIRLIFLFLVGQRPPVVVVNMTQAKEEVRRSSETESVRMSGGCLGPRTFIQEQNSPACSEPRQTHQVLSAAERLHVSLETHRVALARRPSCRAVTFLVLSDFTAELKEFL